MYGMEKFKLNVPLLYRFNILDRHYHIAQDLVYQHIRRGSRFPDEIREIDHVSFSPDNTCFPRWRFDFHAKYLLCSNILSLHNYRFSEFFRKIKENEDKRNFRETEGSLFIRHRIYRYRYNSVNKILSHPNPLFSVYKRKNSHTLSRRFTFFFFNRKTSNKKPVNRMPRLLPCNTLTIFKYRKNISRIACIFRETMCVCMYVYDGVTRRKVRCVSRSIEEAIYPSEISILARLASITLVGGAISCDPRSYKSDTRTPPLRYIYI